MPIFVIEIAIDFSQRAVLVVKNSDWNQQKSSKNEYGYFNVTGSTVQKIGRAAQADFFGKWVEFMNTYVSRVPCMT